MQFVSLRRAAVLFAAVLAALAASAQNSDFCSLCIAAATGDLDEMQKLLDEGANPDMRGPYNSTPLFWAARHGRQEAMTMLMDAGATVDVREERGLTPLFVGVLADRTGVARLLMDRGADPRIHQKGDAGWTPLLAAIRYARPFMTRVLLAKMRELRGPDAPANFRRGPNGITVWHMAAIRGDAGIMRMLLDEVQAAPLFLTSSNANAFMFAAYYGNVEVLQLLVETAPGAQNNKNLHGRTALMIAASLHQGGIDREKTINALLAAESTILDAEDNAGRTYEEYATNPSLAADVIAPPLEPSKAIVDFVL